MANVIEIKITAQNAQAIAALRQVAEAASSTGKQVKSAGGSTANAFQGATTSGEGFIGTMGKVAGKVAGLYIAFQALKEVISTAFGPGFEFNKSMETNQLGMAGILKSMTLINGKAVDFNQAMAISSDMMKKLQQDALLTSASTEDLANVFRAILAPGLNAGMSLDQIRQITVVGTNAVKSLGVPAQQVVQEIRDLVQGGITASGSTLATALGIKDADIEKAKNSSEGLFKFLMARMEGFNETSQRFPDTMAGAIDQLQEKWTMGSSKFSEAFEEPIKEGLNQVSNAIGTVNEKTGQLDINPNLITGLNELKSGVKELRDFAKDVSPAFDEWKTYIVPTLKSGWNIVKSLGSALLDLGRIATVSTEFFRNFALQGIRDLANDIEWLTTQIQKYIDLIARNRGAKSSTTNGIADFRHSEDTNSTVTTAGSDPPVITPKFPGVNTTEIEQSQAALKIAETQIKAEAEIAKTAIKQALEQLEVKKQQNIVSVTDYAKAKAELEYKQQQIEVEIPQRILESVNSASYKDANDKTKEQEKYKQEINTQTAKLKIFGDALAEVSNNLVDMGSQGTTWRKEVSNVNTEGLQDNAVSAIDALSAYFKKLTGKQMVVSSGLRDWGGHVSGTKFDVVDDADSEMLEQNKDGIRDKIIAYARSIGLNVLDEYANPSEKATAGHLDINASGFTATFVTRAKQQFGTILTKTGNEYMQAIAELFKEADEIAKELAEMRGDVSTRQKAELTAKYDQLKKKFETNGMLDQAKMVDELKSATFLKLDFSQEQKNLENANAILADAQKNFLSDIANGSKTAAEATEEYSDQLRNATSKSITELTASMVQATKEKNPLLALQIKAEIEKIPLAIKSFVDDAVKQANELLQQKTSLIDINPNMTNMQKTDAKQELQSQYYVDISNAYSQAAAKISAIEPELIKAGVNPQTIISTLQNLTLYNDELGRTKDLSEKVEIAGRQAFEDGLFTFLTDGITKCESLGDAFKNLANTVLSAIQKVYAESVTKDIMSAFKIGTPTTEKDKNTAAKTATTATVSKAVDAATSTSAATAAASVTANATQTSSNLLGTKIDTVNATLQSILSTVQQLVTAAQTSSTTSTATSATAVPVEAHAEGGTLNSGLVKGPGTGTSDSILAYLGNYKKHIAISQGEYVVKTAAVRKFGTGFFDKLNNGLIPSAFYKVKAKFASGGAVSGKTVAGPEAIAASISSGDTNLHLKIANISDPDDAGRFLQTRKGEKLMLNHMKNNAAVMRQILKLKG